jgi:hypothetical protein
MDAKSRELFKRKDIGMVTGWSFERLSTGIPKGTTQ